MGKLTAEILKEKILQEISEEELEQRKEEKQSSSLGKYSEKGLLYIIANELKINLWPKKEKKNDNSIQIGQHHATHVCPDCSRFSVAWYPNFQRWRCAWSDCMFSSVIEPEQELE